MRFLYLHGFASSPASRKARFFSEKLAEHGIRLEAPDLAPDFERQTITGQLNVVETTAQGQALVLIGSSLGGYLSALYAHFHPTVERILLLAPAFDFFRLWTESLGQETVNQWRENGALPVYHYGMSKDVPLGYQLLEDARRFPAFPEVKQTCLIFHGTNDPVVPVEQSRRFAAAHVQTTTLHLVHSGHELTDVLDEIWNLSKDFLLAASTNSR